MQIWRKLARVVDMQRHCRRGVDSCGLRHLRASTTSDRPSPNRTSYLPRCFLCVLLLSLPSLARLPRFVHSHRQQYLDIPRYPPCPCPNILVGRLPSSIGTFGGRSNGRHTFSRPLRASAALRLYSYTPAARLLGEAARRPSVIAPTKTPSSPPLQPPRPLSGHRVLPAFRSRQSPQQRITSRRAQRPCQRQRAIKPTPFSISPPRRSGYTAHSLHRPIGNRLVS